MLGKTKIKSIAKNGYPREYNEHKRRRLPYEVEIFSEGIAPMLESSIIAQTFGSPRAWKPYCEGDYDVGNSYKIKVGKNKPWRQGSDHCKWAYATENDFVCFGDLNRNTFAQTVRGGAFYCL